MRNSFKLMLIGLFVYLMFICSSCKPVKVQSDFQVDSTIVYVDSFGVNGHSYIKFLDYSGNFQVLHNPDCFCRYNRTFVIIKRSK